ncbi:MAG: hypothetical protein ACOYUZ_04960 [Patescibacteria group bacterium]
MSQKKEIVMTRKSVTDEQFGRLQRRLGELARRVDEGSVEFEPAMTALQLLVEGKRLIQQPLCIPEGGHPYRGGPSGGPENAELIRSLFTPVEAQLTRVRELNAERGWGFTDEDFAEAERSVPPWPAGNLVAVTLVPYLPDADGMGGVERTFQELWKAAAAAQEKSWRWGGYDKAGPDRLRLLKGIDHPGKDQPVLRWEVIDLGCNRNRKPVDVRDPKTSPHAGVIASAMLHPEWVKAMDGYEVPYAWAPGYEVNFSDGIQWQGVPNLGFDRGVREIRLGCGWYDSCYSSWAAASLVREPLGSR